MNEEVSNKSVNLAVSATRVTARLLYRALLEYTRRLHYRHDRNKNNKTVFKYRGKQTLKQLIGQNQGVSSMDIGDSDLRVFKRIANKYGVDFAITKDKSADKPKYMVFFKARDADAITNVLQEYSAKVIKKVRNEPTKESVIEKLRKLKEAVKAIPRKERKREITR